MSRLNGKSVLSVEWRWTERSRKSLQVVVVVVSSKHVTGVYNLHQVQATLWSTLRHSEGNGFHPSTVFDATPPTHEYRYPSAITTESVAYREHA